jgi:hypothetical protein
MSAPDRLTVPTCIGCGAMSRFGTCDTGCSEQKLELVPATAYDSLAALQSGADMRADAFRTVADELAWRQPAADEWETSYRSVQEDARAALSRHPDAAEQDIDWEQPAETATTWLCPTCGGIDAPQPCLGICIWRPIEWVNRTLYEHARERALSLRQRERRLRRLLRRVASVTPQTNQWERNWRALQADASYTLKACDESAPTSVA